MKLNAKLKRQLLTKSPYQPDQDDALADLLDDTCELLTAQIVLFLKKLQREVLDRRASLPLGDPEANLLAAQARALGEAFVALAEAQ